MARKHKHLKKNAVILLLTLFTLFFSSCAVQQSISNTESYTSFTVYPFLENLTSDVASWAAFENRDEFFEKNLMFFAENLEDNYGTSYVDLRKKYDAEGPKVYGVYFSFESLEALSENILKNTVSENESVSGREEKHFISFTETEGAKRFDITISLETWEELSRLIPLLKEPNLEVYGPVYNNPPYGTKTEEEYYYMIDFIFGSGSEDIKKSWVDIRFKAPGAIKDTNGTAINTSESETADSVEFRIPLIDVLLLHEPIHFFCEWENS